jgi:hypothetical protein
MDDDPPEADCRPLARSYGAVSLVGGALTLATLVDRSSCSGADPVSWVVSEVQVVGEASEEEGGAEETCVAGVPFEDWATLDRPCPPGAGGRPECVGCEAPEPDAWVRMLWSGQIVELGLGAAASGQLVSVVRASEAGGDLCPSAFDTCGTAEQFPGLETADAFWVTTDGSVALAQHGSDLSVQLAGEVGAYPTGAAVEGEVIGVRFHDDARPLRAAIDGSR